MADISDSELSELVHKKPKFSMQQGYSKIRARNQEQMEEENIEAIILNDTEDLAHLIETDIYAPEPTGPRIAEETNRIEDIDPATTSCLFDPALIEGTLKYIVSPLEKVLTISAKHTELLKASRGYELALNPNADMLCYIDAPFEML
ncbi:hypothetical protein DFQ28_006128 [Apophysomyces sp. BC1034]|nr:hypothetical protein DFQ30_006100 [Apophysomyces sp. BC1015]KAG0187559.1 hypothetical protein DFQ28_006128 [Apophysomyces sp. BC1034]